MGRNAALSVGCTLCTDTVQNVSVRPGLHLRNNESCCANYILYRPKYTTNPYCASSSNPASLIHANTLIICPLPNSLRDTVHVKRAGHTLSTNMVNSQWPARSTVHMRTPVEALCLPVHQSLPHNQKSKYTLNAELTKQDNNFGLFPETVTASSLNEVALGSLPLHMFVRPPCFCYCF